MVTPHPRPKEARKEPWRGPTRTTGSVKQVRLCVGPNRKQCILTERIVDTEVETTVDDDTNDRGDEASVEAGNTVRLEGLTVDVDETIELAVSSALCGLGVIGKTSTSVIKRVDEEQRGSTSGTTGGDVTAEPLPVAIRLLETEQGLEIIL